MKHDKVFDDEVRAKEYEMYASYLVTTTLEATDNRLIRNCYLHVTVESVIRREYYSNQVVFGVVMLKRNCKCAHFELLNSSKVSETTSQIQVVNCYYTSVVNYSLTPHSGLNCKLKKRCMNTLIIVENCIVVAYSLVEVDYDMVNNYSKVNHGNSEFKNEKHKYVCSLSKS